MARLIGSRELEECIIPHLSGQTLERGDFINALIIETGRFFRQRHIGFTPDQLRIAYKSLGKAGKISHEEKDGQVFIRVGKIKRGKQKKK